MSEKIAAQAKIKLMRGGKRVARMGVSKNGRIKVVADVSLTSPEEVRLIGHIAKGLEQKLLELEREANLRLTMSHREAEQYMSEISKIAWQQ
jgi:hypothetical protein